MLHVAENKQFGECVCAYVCGLLGGLNEMPSAKKNTMT